jgi:tetratricopeptide (TPR) repeat protein
MRRLICAAAATLAALCASPAAAEFLPRPQDIATADERPIATELAQDLMRPASDVGEALARLDAFLPRLRQPTRLRGLLQFLRGSALEAADRDAEAREPLEESIRLLPGYSAPLLIASRLEAYADRPAPAADYLLRASEIDPDLVARIDDYEVFNIVHRLRQQQDQRRLSQLAERLFAIGWLGEGIALRSSLALEAIRERIHAGDTDGVRALLPRLVVPRHVQALLTQNRYSAVWQELERWAGPQQRNLWAPYLQETRSKWRATRDPERAREYVTALQEAGHLATLANEMLPAFGPSLHREHDYDLIWAVSPLADALARQGRWEDLERLFARASQVWPLELDANAINITGNQARFRLYRGDAAGALAGLDRTIAQARRWPGQVSAGALATMHFYRACALQELGRRADALDSVSVVVSQPQAPVAIAGLQICFGEHEAARALLLAALQQEELRSEVIFFLQPDDTPPYQSEYGRLIAERTAALRADPALRAAVERHGRIMPEPLSAGAPAEERVAPEAPR